MFKPVRWYTAFVLMGVGASFAACTSNDVTIREDSSTSLLPSASVWRCTSDVSLTVRRSGVGIAIEDSRGFETELPPDPPGQRVRFAKTGYAFVIDGRSASWFASGQRPTDCRR